MALACLLLVGWRTVFSASQGPWILVHRVWVEVVPERPLYRIHVAFSLFDPDSNLLLRPRPEVLEVWLDEASISNITVEGPVERPLQLLLLMDQSGSMRGWKADRAMEAATLLLTLLKPSDRVALWGFHERVQVMTDFRSPTQGLQALDWVRREPARGTCLYDALAQGLAALQEQAEAEFLPVLWVFTDGVDELPSGEPCSRIQAEDVRRMAERSQIPVFIVALGHRVERTFLEDLSLTTGGFWMHLTGPQDQPSQISAWLQGLQGPWVATFDIAASPGPHTLTLRYRDGERVAAVTRQVVLPPLPYVIEVKYHWTEEERDPMLKVEVAVKGGEGLPPVAEAQLLYQGEVRARDGRPPYVLAWRSPDAREDVFSLQVRLVDGSGQVLAEKTVEVIREVDRGILMPPWVWAGVGILVAGVALGTWWWKGRKMRRIPEEILDHWGGVTVFPDVRAPFLPRAYLEVLSSDDPACVGRMLVLSKERVTLGRRGDNDFPFPQDRAVSRHHAEIVFRGGVFYLQEVFVDDDEGPRGPKYGTFVNDERVVGRVRLRSGDVIRLGPRLRLRFVVEEAGEFRAFADETLHETEDDGQTQGVWE